MVQNIMQEISMLNCHFPNPPIKKMFSLINFQAYTKKTADYAIITINKSGWKKFHGTSHISSLYMILDVTFAY